MLKVNDKATGPCKELNSKTVASSQSLSMSSCRQANTSAGVDGLLVRMSWAREVQAAELQQKLTLITFKDDGMLSRQFAKS